MRGKISIKVGDFFRKLSPGIFDLQIKGTRDPWRPCGLLDTMVLGVAGFSGRGVIWYQGEGDFEHPQSYAKLFALVIRSWRKSWGDELPFLFVQLAGFERDIFDSGDSFPEIRRQQELAAETVPGVWMVSAIDLGAPHNIHPGRKRPVGERLAAAAKANVYSMDVPWASPKAQQAERSNTAGGREDSKTIVIRFSNCDRGLRVGNGDTSDRRSVDQRFVDQRFVTRKGADRKAKVKGLRLFSRGVEVTEFTAALAADTLAVTAAGPVDEVRYAWEPYTEMNLYNAAGFPVLPFVVRVEGLL
jgi:sialate O-acetylesterase